VTKVEKQRVCVVGPGKKFLSGISYYTLHLANTLVESNRVSVILMRQLLPKKFYPGKKRVGANLTQLEYDSDIRVFDGVDWYWLPSMFRALVFLVQERPDEVVLQWWTGTVLHSYLLIAVVAKLLRANVIVEFHEVLDTGEARLPIARAYVRLIAPLIVNMANGFVIHSEYDRELLKKHYNLEKRLIALIPHGPYYQYHETNDEQKFQNTESSCCNLLFFGLIRPYKGLENLIMAFDALPENVIDKYRLTVVGETWEGWDKPKALIEQSQYRDRITFVNRYVTDIEVTQFFEAANAVVLPYHRSSTSGPLHIAMSYGLPVIVTKVGGLVEAVRNYEGAMLVEPEDVLVLQKALLQVVNLCGMRYSNPRSWEYTNTSYQALFDAFRASNNYIHSSSRSAFPIQHVQEQELTKNQ
jgi:glycosyltransferase involved in cell wall biosynthesis